MPIFKERCMRNIDRALAEMQKHFYTTLAPLTVEAYLTAEPLPYDRRTEGEYTKIQEGTKWGEVSSCGWFHVQGQVPQSAKGQSVVLIINVGAECIIFDDNVNPVQGLTHVDHNYYQGLGVTAEKQIFRISPCANGGEVIDFWMDVGRRCLIEEGIDEAMEGLVTGLKIAARNEELWQMHFDFHMLRELLKCIPGDSARYSAVLFCLQDAANVLKTYSAEEAASARAILAKEINKKGGDPSLTLTTLGHAHIDLAWLWPIRETRRKGGRTFANVLKLMEQYDDCVFGASQPQLYDWVKEDYPDIYRRVKERVNEGRWELQGGMWVEPDTNVPSGESLIRQFLYGKRFYQEEFGQDIRNLWLPDVFGYSAALPQIMLKCGVDYFMTNKLAVNEFNRFPHHTFVWEGIDGSRVMSHMISEGTYNGSLTPLSLMAAEKNHFENGICEEALIFYGVGDGGGGPGEEHMERYARLRDLQGLVPVNKGFSQDLFDRLAVNQHRYDVYKGELYFERHQGTYTSQCKSKWYNRTLEFALHELEFLLAMINPADYPVEELEAIWKEFLLYQFHDILPGSSINRVYDESIAGYAKMEQRIAELTADACAKLAGRGAVTVNSLSWDRWDWVEADGRKIKVAANALSAEPVNEIPADLAVLRAEGNTIENAALRVTFNADGSVASVYDKANGRETMRVPAGNRFAVWQDAGDCWDIPIEYLHTTPEYFTLKEQTAAVEGCAACMKQVYTYGKSTITQTVCLEEGREYVDFRTVADWYEDRKMLRTSFDVDIVADSAAYEIQFGFLRRGISENNPYEAAKYEVCAHKWADLSQGNYGVALMNDCKYGYRVKDSVLDLHLLRSQDFPGVGSDRGRHEFRYALYPHTGDTANSDVAKQGYEYNLPLSIKAAGGEISGKSMFSVNGGVFLDTVKRAESGDGTLLRFYDPNGCGGTAEVSLSGKYSGACACDMLENPGEPVSIDDGKFTFEFRPFEVLSFLLKD